jgi:hypothetical protein
VLTLQGVIVNDINEVPVDLTNTGSSSAAESVRFLSYWYTKRQCGEQPICLFGRLFANPSIRTGCNDKPGSGANGAINVGGGSVANTSAADIWLKLYNKFCTFARQ